MSPTVQLYLFLEQNAVSNIVMFYKLVALDLLYNFLEHQNFEYCLLEGAMGTDACSFYSNEQPSRRVL